MFGALIALMYALCCPLSTVHTLCTSANANYAPSDTDTNEIMSHHSMGAIFNWKILNVHYPIRHLQITILRVSCSTYIAAITKYWAGSSYTLQVRCCKFIASLLRNQSHYCIRCTYIVYTWRHTHTARTHIGIHRIQIGHMCEQCAGNCTHKTIVSVSAFQIWFVSICISSFHAFPCTH